MRASWVVLSVTVAALGGTGAGLAAPKAADTPGDPSAVSVHPFSGARGSTFAVTVRGHNLRGADAVFLEQAPLQVRIEGCEAEPPEETGAKSKTPFDLVHLRVTAAADAPPGRYLFRLVTPRGVSNALPLYVSDLPVSAEPAGSHETPDTAVPVEKLPAAITGRIERRGETDYYAFQAPAGETLTFEALSGLPSTGAPGGNAVGFDPALSIYEPSGSWFDPSRVNRIAFNDEPLWVIGGQTDAYLTHRFEKGGRYLLRVEAFSGQGGPDYSYCVRILPGKVPESTLPAEEGWTERAFPRALSTNRLNELAARGGLPQNRLSIETYRAAAVAAKEAPFFKLPGTLEGGLRQPGETHRARFHLDRPEDIAIEVETPATAPPLFNPVVRLLDGAGAEVATNVFAGRGACNGELSKSLAAKTTVPLRDPGDYTLEIRDVTADLADAGFRYRVQVRPQIPHVGQVRIEADHVNLEPGAAKTIRVTFDREEDYRGAVAVAAESLPPGVQALSGADFEPDKDPPRFPGKRERYTPRTERAVLIFTVASDAAPSGPHLARLVVRPVTDGKPGAVVASKEIPVMVIAKP
ncbi:MAG TPA: hypothetical protein VFA33_03470 [Bryobacteraceae bacterium]|nr:hypothetical protein [Bryobacteraceae bacterium]